MGRTKQQLERFKKHKPTVYLGSKHLSTLQHSSYKLNHRAWKEKWHKARYRQVVISGRKDAVQGDFVFRYDIETHSLKWTTMRGIGSALSNIRFPYGQEWLNQALLANKKGRCFIAWAIEDYDDYFIIKVIADVAIATDLNDSKANGIVATDANVINPAFTSQIGKVKYMKQKGLSVYISSAYTIARCALGLKEKVPNDSINYVLEEISVNIIGFIGDTYLRN